MRRFRSGTLERSIRRWGPRFPRIGRAGFKKKNFGTIYAHLTGADLDLPVNGNLFDVNLFDSTDWNNAAHIGTDLVVRNVSVDIAFGLVGLPVNGNVIGETSLRWGIFLVDSDDTFSTLDDYFSEYRAIVWGIQPFIASTRNTATSSASAPAMELGFNMRRRFRISKVRETQTLTYAAALDISINGIWQDATHPLATRIRYELP